MKDSGNWKRYDKLLPKLVLRPYDSWFPCKLDNHWYVQARPSPVLLLTVLFGTISFPGIILLLGAYATSESWAFISASCFLIAGGSGCILADPYKKSRYCVLDRQKGVVRFWTSRQFGKRRRIVQVPFDECEARTINHCIMRATLTFYHQKQGYIARFSVTEEDRARSIWSFLVQFMDKKAPLPDTSHFAPYANRTKGSDSVAKLEEGKKIPNLVDPLAVWRKHQSSNPPEEAKRVYEVYSPRHMPVNVAVAPEAKGEHIVREPCGTTTSLPKQVLRPFEKPEPVVLDKTHYIYKRPSPDSRYYYLAGWVVLCAGIALFAVHTAAALGAITVAVLIFFGIKHLRRSKGTILDRKNGLVIFHKGLSFAPRKLPFNECEGRLIKTEHVEGFDSYRLYLHHPSHGSFALDDDDFLSLDLLLGFWSFVVQYMDRNAPLPYTKETEHLENTTHGVGPWDKWACEAVGPGFVDPFAQWLEKVEQK